MTLLDTIQMLVSSNSNNYYERGPLYSMTTIVVVRMDDEEK